jgi:Beta-propeller repeat
MKNLRVVIVAVALAGFSSCTSDRVSTTDAGEDGPVVDLGPDIDIPGDLCLPSCSSKACGSQDGCGGTCQNGGCSKGSTCRFGKCTCVYLKCGSGCCGVDQICKNSNCCTPQCGGRTCGPDPICGATCGKCPLGKECRTNGQCSLPKGWVRSGGGASSDEAKGVAVDASGNVFLTGAFYNKASFGKATIAGGGGDNFFVAKFDRDGAALWAHTPGGSSDHSAESIAVDTAGNAFVTGHFEGPVTFGATKLVPLGSGDIFVVKYSSAGKIIWVNSAGWNLFDNGMGVDVDPGGNIFVSGYFRGPAKFGSITVPNTAGFDVFLTKYSNSGKEVWARSGIGLGWEFGLDVAIDDGGDAYVTGFFNGSVAFGATSLSSKGADDIFVARYSQGGKLLWARSAGGLLVDWGSSIAVDSSKNVYVTGSFEGNATFGTTTLASKGDASIFVAKYSPQGQLLWAESAGGSSEDGGTGIAVDSGGNAYMVGGFKGKAAFGSVSLSSKGGEDIFVARYASGGKLIGAVSAGGTGDDHAADIAMDANGTPHIAGTFQGTCLFDKTALTTKGYGDAFVWKLSIP